MVRKPESNWHWTHSRPQGGTQIIRQLTAPGGRLYESRRAIGKGVGNSEFLSPQAPEGAMYAFARADMSKMRAFDERKFALELLEQKHILIAPGSSFNVPCRDHFRITTLPAPGRYVTVFRRIGELLETMC